MKQIIFALILSACVTEPVDEPPQANLDAIPTANFPEPHPPHTKACRSTVHELCGERPERKPTEEWAHDIDLWSKCAEEATPATTP